MSLKLQIETAKEAVSKALITALQDKNEEAVSNLITCYNTLNKTKVVEPFKIDLSTPIYSNSNNNIPCSYFSGGDDYINFGAAGPTTIGGAWGNDTISFSLS